MKCSLPLNRSKGAGRFIRHSAVVSLWSGSLQTRSGAVTVRRAVEESFHASARAFLPTGGNAFLPLPPDGKKHLGLPWGARGARDAVLPGRSSWEDVRSQHAHSSYCYRYRGSPCSSTHRNVMFQVSYSALSDPESAVSVKP